MVAILFTQMEGHFHFQKLLYRFVCVFGAYLGVIFGNFKSIASVAFVGIKVIICKLFTFGKFPSEEKEN